MLVVMGQRMVKVPNGIVPEVFVNALGYEFDPTMNIFGEEDVELTKSLPIERARNAQRFYGNRDLFMDYFDGETVLKKALASVNLQADKFDQVDVGVYVAKLGDQDVATIKMKDGSFEIQAV